MVLALPGAKGLFSNMQEFLCHVKDKKVAMSKGVHEALVDFSWLAENLANRPTCIYKLVPLRPTVDGYHNAYGYMCGSVLLPGPMAYLGSCRRSLALRDHPRTPSRLTL